MSKYSLKNRINAFIFLENTFVQAKSHTQCIITILIQEEIVKDERDFYRQMKDHLFETYINHLVSEIESQSVFGEFAFYDGRFSIIVFEKLNRYGLSMIQEKSRELFGEIPIYYLNLNNKNRIVLKLT